MQTHPSPLTRCTLLVACCVLLAAAGCAGVGPAPEATPSTPAFSAGGPGGENGYGGHDLAPAPAEVTDRLPPPPDDLPQAAAAAWRALSRGDLSRAHRELEALPAEDGSRHDAVVVRGYLAWASGDLDEARRRFEASSSQQRPKPALALYGLGLVSEAEGDRQEAIRRYAEALDLDPRMMAAALALRMAELEEARELLLHVQRDAHLPDGFTDTGNGNVAAGNGNGAAGNGNGAAGNGGVAAGNGHATPPPRSAEEAYHRVIELAPELLPPYLELAALYDRRGEAAAVVSTLERARHHNGDHPRLLRELARARRATGDTEQALTTLRSLQQIVPDDPELDALIAETRRKHHRESVPESIHRLEESPTVRRDELAALIASRLPSLEDVPHPGDGDVIVDIEGNPLAPYIRTVVELGIMETFGNHGFAPDLEVSRGMLAPIAYRVLQLFQDADAASYPSIADVPSRHVRVREIQVVVGRGIMELDPSRRFRGLEKVTGAEVVQVITRLGQTVRETVASRTPQR